RSTIRASSAPRPRTRSTTRRIFWADRGRYLAIARTSIALYRLTPLPSLLLDPDVAAEGACGGELAQLVPHHVFRDVDGHVAAAIMNRDGVPHHLREDGGGAAPGADHLFLAALVHDL